MNGISIILYLTFALLAAPGVQAESTIDDNEMGMGTLFDMVNIFTGDVLHKERIGDSFLNLSKLFKGGEFRSEPLTDWRAWMKYLIGFAVCAAIGIVFIVVMPIAGLVFCCCRLCGRCGGKPGKNIHKRAKCKRRTYCTLLTILTTVALAGVVCAFVCNSILYKHLQNDNNEGSLGHLNQSIGQIDTFISKAISNYTSYISDVFTTTSQNILRRVKDITSNVVDKALEIVNADGLLNEATKLSRGANETKQILDNITAILADLKHDSIQLKDNLTDIKNSTAELCRNNPQLCSKFNESEYDVDADFNSLDGFDSQTANFDKLKDMGYYIDKANKSLTKTKNDARGNVDKQVKDAENAIEDVKGEVDKGINELTSQETKLSSNFPEIYKNIDDGNNSVRKYSDYVYYGVIGVCCAYLLIVVLYYIGLLFGICGEKPGDGAPCCNSGCGANFLLAGVGFTFIFSWILMIICTVLFCLGGPAYTEICRYFDGHDPSQFKVFDGTLKDALNLDKYLNTSVNFSISGAIKNCQENQALFSALQLDNIVNLDKILDISKVNVQLDGLKNANFTLGNVTFSKDISSSLDNLTNSGLDRVNFTKYFTEFSKHLTKGNLSYMADALEQIAVGSNNNTEKDILNSNAARLRQLNNQTLPEITQKVDKLNGSLIQLQKMTSLVDTARNLKINLTQAEDIFNRDKSKIIKDELGNFIQGVINDITSQIKTIIYEVRNEKAKCQDVSNALYTMSDAVCIQLLEPVNGLWFSFGWCLFFFVPCLIFAVLLVGQYRRTLEEDKEFEEANYMMYGGPNPDTIPLTSVDRVNSRSGMTNAGYRDESKRSHYADPPPYNAHAVWQCDISRPKTRA